MAAKWFAERQRGRKLEYFTIAWNAVEGLVAVASGILARGISLVEFGIDSFIEVNSGSVGAGGQCNNIAHAFPGAPRIRAVLELF